MACKYKAPNGNDSNVYQELKSRFGHDVALSTYLYSHTSQFKAAHPSHPLDGNGEPAVNYLIDNNLVYKKSQLYTGKENKIDAKQKEASLKEAFKKAGVDVIVEENESLDVPARVMKKNNRVTVQMNPELMQSDTLYHEFGHVLVEGLGDDDPLVKAGIEMLQGTEIWNLVSFFNQDLEGARLGKEVLVSAIGIEADRIFKDQKDKPKWVLWLQEFFRKLGQKLGIEPSAVETLARQLTQANLDKKLNLKLRDYTENQRGMRIVRSSFKTKHDVVTNAAAILEQKIHDYFRNLSKEERESNKHYREFTELRDSLLKLNKLDANKAIIEFLSFAYQQTGSLEKRMNEILNNVHPNKPVEVDALALKNILNYNSVFGDILDDMIQLTETDVDLKATLTQITTIAGAPGSGQAFQLDGSLYQNIQEIRARHLRVLLGAKRVGILYLAQKMLTTGVQSNFETHLRDKLAREWNKLGDNLKRLQDSKQRAAAEADRQKFVDERIAELKRRIDDPDNFSKFEEVANEYYVNLLQQSPGDISWLERMFLTGNYVSEETIQVASEMLDEADFNVRQESIKEFRKAIPVFEAFDAQARGTTQIERHDAMLEDELEFDVDTFEMKKTGKKRQNLVSKYYSQFYDVKRLMWVAVERAVDEHGEGSTEADDALRNLKAFLKRNAIRVEDADGNATYHPNRLWLNPQWSNDQGTGIMDRAENDPTRKAYEYLIQRLEEDDAKLPPAYQLVKTNELGDKVYRLPSVIKHSQIEIVGDVGVGGYMKHKIRRIKNALAGNPEDSTEYGTDPADTVPNEFNRILQVQADEQGREQHYVPVNLRRPVSLEDQSFDLFTVILLNHAMAANYEHKSDIAVDLELFRDILADREVVRTDNVLFKGTRQKVNKVLRNLGIEVTPIVDDAEQSNAYKAFENLLETRLYGLASKGSVAANEIAAALTSYTGTLLLSANYLSAGANLLSGQLQSRIDAMSGQHITNEDLNFAHFEYVSSIPAMSRDLGRSAPVSKIGKLVELLNPMSNWEPIANKFVRNSVAKRLYAHMDPSILQTMGEHAIQTTVSIAVLHNAKALSITGKYLNKNFEETENIKEAISLYEAYNQQAASGIIELHPNVAGFEKGGVKITERDKINFTIGRMIKELNKQLNGNYDNKEIAEARRSPIGKLALVMRRWYPYTLTRRVRGIGTVKRSSEELEIDEKYFNRAFATTDEGYYTTWLRFLGQTWKNAKKIKLEMGRTGGIGFLQSLGQAQREVKADMLHYERSNMYRMYYDMAATALYVMLATTLVMLAKAIEDKDDRRRKSLFVLAYWVLKAQRELMSYYNPNEVLRTVGTISVVLPQLQQMVDLVLQFGEDIGGQIVHPGEIERYERGKRKGQSKLWKEFTDVFPILKQTSKDVETQFSYMMNVKGW